MGTVIGYFTILFESACILSLILTMAAAFCGYGFEEIELFSRKESTWIKETRYYEAFPSIDIPIDRSGDKVEIPSELKSRSNLRCAKCGCVYIPTPNCEPSPTPKYCMECGRKMINWKEIKI